MLSLRMQKRDSASPSLTAEKRGPVVYPRDCTIG